MSRGDRRAAVAIALALGGCMRIYPDPELPDIVVEWFTDFDCSAGGDRVVASLSTGDLASEVGRAAVPCEDGSLRFKDVARVQYRLSAHLEDSTGAVHGDNEIDIDLRDGISKRVNTFFGGTRSDNFRVAWVFDMGGSCEALSVASMRLRASKPGGETITTWEVPCDAPAFVNLIPLAGTFTLSVRAISAGAVVATSPESAPLAVTPGAITDFGTLTLSACGAACP